MQGVLLSRAVFRISGDDSRPFLQGLVTQEVVGLKEGEAAFAALLTPQGKILFDFILAPHADGFLLDCDARSAAALVKRLTLYKLRAKVAIAEQAGLAVAVGDDDGAFVSFADPRLDSLPRRAIVLRETQAPPADDSCDAMRLTLGVPEFGRDFVGEEVFLLDVNYDALAGVSYTKGCFVGQEVTSRMKRKGEIRKRTLIARFEGEAPPKGASIMAGDNAIGEILSGRDGTALALIRIDRLEAAEAEGRPLTADGRTLRLAFPDYLEAG